MIHFDFMMGYRKHQFSFIVQMSYVQTLLLEISGDFLNLQSGTCSLLLKKETLNWRRLWLFSHLPIHCGNRP